MQDIPTFFTTTNVEIESMSGSPSGSSLTPQTLPSSAEHAKLALPQDQMNALNEAMREESYYNKWSTLLKIAANNPQELRDLMSVVLACFTLILTKNGFSISGLQVKEADTLVGSFNESEFKEWDAGLRTGVNTGKWEDLVAHRTYHPILNGRMACQIFISKVD